MILLVAALMIACALWLLRALPPGEPSPARGGNLGDALASLREIWRTFFRKPQIGMLLLVCFFYRFDEGFIEKFGPLYLLNPRTAGGLGLTNSEIGTIYGTLSPIGLLAGSLLGGAVAHMLYMMQQIAPGPFKVAYYAFATAVMGLTKWVAGTLSAGLYVATGRDYPLFLFSFSSPRRHRFFFARIATFPRRVEHEERPPGP